jgi:aromatase
MTLHTGRWLIRARDGGGVSVTSRHTVRLNESRIAGVLGAGTGLPDAQQAVRNALSANSLATLGLAKAYAEEAASRRAAS